MSDMLEGRTAIQKDCDKVEKWGGDSAGWALLAREQLCRKGSRVPTRQAKWVKSVQRRPTLHWADVSNSAASKTREVTTSLTTVGLHLEYCVQLWDPSTRKPLTIWVTAREKEKIIKTAGMLEHTTYKETGGASFSLPGKEEKMTGEGRVIEKTEQDSSRKCAAKGWQATCTSWNKGHSDRI